MHASPVDWETPLHLAQEACLLHPKINRGSPRSPAPAAQTQRASARVLVASQPRSASGLRIWSANRTPSSYRAVGRPPGEPRPAGATVLQNMVTEVGFERSPDRENPMTETLGCNATQVFCGAMGRMLRPYRDVRQLPSLMTSARVLALPEPSGRKVTPAKTCAPLRTQTKPAWKRIHAGVDSCLLYTSPSPRD